MGERQGSRKPSELERRRWKAADARRVLSAWRASGLSMSAFAAQRGLEAQRLSWWKARLRDWDPNESAVKARPVMRLVEAVVRSRPGEAQAVVRLPGGVVVEVMDTSAVSPQWLAGLGAGLAGVE